MKHTIYISLLAAALCTGCMGGEKLGFDDDWSAPALEESPFGNNAIQELPDGDANKLTIAQLKAKYLTKTDANYHVEITDDVQIKGVVVGNDIAGNIYNEVALQDAAGDAILICIAQGGLFAYLSTGTEIIVNLKGLHIGCYGNQPQIGTPYTNSSGKTFPSRMSRNEWQTRFKIIGTGRDVQPEEFDVARLKDKEYVKSHCGKLMTVKGVAMSEADGTKTWAPEADKDAGNGVSRTVAINGKANSLLVVRSSTYADFAALAMPTGSINLTGIFTVYASNPDRYGYTWQILLRSEKDIEAN